MMWSLAGCLVLPAVWGVLIYGPQAAWVLASAVASAVATEAVMSSLGGRFTLSDGSAVVTGLLIGLSLPPVVSPEIPVLASVFAVGVVKWSFGGVGATWMNPALAGRVCVSLIRRSGMDTWTSPWIRSGADAVTTATPLAHARAIGTAATVERIAAESSFPGEGAIVSFLNETIFLPLGAELPRGYVTLFLGNSAGSIGEASALLLLAGSVFLIGRGVVHWGVPAAYFLGFSFLVRVFGTIPGESALFTGDVLFHLLSGSFILTAFYAAPDLTSTPKTTAGHLLFGLGAGILTFLFRRYGASPEGTAIAVLLMNILVPIINRLTKPRRFGWGSRKHRLDRAVEQESHA
jgi:Na+-translocating ferredoxin:NAD+ oxidoreductase subunit D